MRPYWNQTRCDLTAHPYSRKTPEQGHSFVHPPGEGTVNHYRLSDKGRQAADGSNHLCYA
ncbi:protein of unknown function [Magnetospira sp. QH-2]|nr:protein of unknown function [Magnetospira sp. QH-2]